LVCCRLHHTGTRAPTRLWLACRAEWGIDGVIAPYWNDLNVCESGNVCGGNGGGGTVLYQVFADSMVAQWEQVRFYVDPAADSGDPLCDPAVTPAGEGTDESPYDNSWAPYWWTPACPASQDPTTSTFQAILFGDGSLQFNYKDMAVVDADHWFHQPRGTGRLRRGPSVIVPLQYPLYRESLWLQEISVTNNSAPSYIRAGLSWSPASIGYEVSLEHSPPSCLPRCVCLCVCLITFLFFISTILLFLRGFVWGVV
jgi:hypothetical protein